MPCRQEHFVTLSSENLRIDSLRLTPGAEKTGIKTCFIKAVDCQKIMKNAWINNPCVFCNLLIVNNLRKTRQKDTGSRLDLFPSLYFVDEGDEDAAEDAGAEGAHKDGHLAHVAQLCHDFRSLVTE